MGRFTDARNKAKRGKKEPKVDATVEVTEEPAAEAPGADEPVVEAPVVEESVAEEPVAEEPVAEEPTAEEPTAEEPTAEEPTAEEPVSQETEPQQGTALSLPAFGLAEDILAALDGQAESQAAGPAPSPAEEGSDAAAETLIPDVTGEHDAVAVASADPFAKITSGGGSDETDSEAHVDELYQLVTFYLGDEEYALHIAEVQEINRVVDITRVPNAPAHVRGVINLRGRIIPVIELKRRLSLGDTELDTHSRIVVAEHGPKVLGLMVDKVSAVLTVRASQIEDAPDEVVREQRNYVKGVCKLEDRMLILLDLSEVIGVAKAA